MNSEKTRTYALARIYLAELAKKADSSDNMARQVSYASFDSSLNEKFKKNILYKNNGLRNYSFEDVFNREYGDAAFAARTKAAYDGLSETDKADLEFFMIQLANGGASSLVTVFDQAIKKEQFDILNAEITQSRNNLDSFYATTMQPLKDFPFLCAHVPYMIYFGAQMLIFACSNNEMNSYVDQFGSLSKIFSDQFSVAFSKSSSSFNAIEEAANTYIKSSQSLVLLKGSHSGGGTNWAEFNRAMNACLTLNDDEAKTYADLYTDFAQKDSTTNAYSNSEALAAHQSINDLSHALTLYARHKEEVALADLETAYQEDERSRIKAESDYRAMYQRFVNGEEGITVATLKAAAEKAFGSEAASHKRHFSNLSTVHIEQLQREDAAGSAQTTSGLYSFSQLLSRVWSARYEAEKTVRNQEWQILQQDLINKQNTWHTAADLILSRGMADFDKGFARLTHEQTIWRQQFEETWMERNALWEESFAHMMTQKLNWVNRATETADNRSSIAIARQLGDSAEQSERELELLTIESLSGETSATQLLTEALAASGIVNMFTAMQANNGLVNTAAQAVRTGLGGPSSWDAGTIQANAATWAREANKELATRQAKIMAERIRDQAEQGLQSLSQEVDARNQGVSDSMDSTYQNGFWTISGDRYEKDVVVHSTVKDRYITEHKSVQRYKNMDAPELTLSVDRSDQVLEAMDADGLKGLMNIIMAEVQQHRETLFGKDNAKNEEILIDTRTWKEDTGETEEYTETITHVVGHGEDRETTTTTVTLYRPIWETKSEDITVSKSPGTFGAYIGYAPLTLSTPDLEAGYSGIFYAKTLENNEGIGEIGRLMAAYIYYSMVEGKGYAEANKPVYDRALWDSRGQFIQAPSIRGVADMGLTVAAALLTGPGVAAVLTLADDAVFGVLDAANGYESWENVGLEFGKKAAVSAFSAYTGNVFGKAMEAAKTVGGLSGVVGRTLLSGTQALTNSIGTNMINAFEFNYNEDGSISGLGFNGDMFTEATFGRNAIAGYVGTMAATAFGSSVNYGGSYENKLFEGLTSIGTMAVTEGAKYATHLGFAAYDGKRGADMFSSAWDAHGGITLGLNAGSLMNAIGFLGRLGNTDYSAVNAERFNKVANAFGSVGLAMTFGSKGVSAVIGGGGYDLINMGMQIGKGFALNSKMKALQSKDAQRYDMFKAAYGHGDFAAEETVWRLLNGRDTLDITSGTGKAQTTMGANGRIIRMNESDYLSGAITLQHEAWRDGRIGTAEQQNYETYRAAEAHTLMAMSLAKSSEYGSAMNQLIGQSENLQNDIGNYLYGDFASYVAGAYDSSADFWKLMDDGTLIRDGRKSVYNEDGFRIMNLEGMEDDISSLAYILNAFQGGISKEDFQLAMLQNAQKNESRTFDESIAAQLSFINSMVDKDAAGKILEEAGGQSVHFDLSKESDVSVRNAFYNFLHKQGRYGFSEETFNGMLPGLRREGLGYFIDYTRLNSDELIPSVCAPSPNPTVDSFHNMGIAGTQMYYVMGKVEDTQRYGYSEKDLPSKEVYHPEKQVWQRDATYETRRNNSWQGRLTGTGLNDDIIADQRNYAYQSFSGGAFAGGIDMVTDLSKGAAMSLLNQTQFHQWQQDGIPFFTVLQPKDIAQPSINTPVSYFNLVTSRELNRMMNWYGLQDDNRRKNIRIWNDIVGWNSLFTRNP